MRKNNDRLMIDLAKLTMERVHDTIDLTTQLIDSESDVAGVMMLVAADLIDHASRHLARSDMAKNEAEALNRVLQAIFNAIGTRKVRAALKVDKELRQQQRSD